ncbi:hypothetical protein AAG570_003515 [Ranatra chinensis]|uniref:Uncharacterized protein n=1 Tax=Ranatra chinensis TaxID=642074 RepID=A0ABD0Y544_9HEMI
MTTFRNPFKISRSLRGKFLLETNKPDITCFTYQLRTLFSSSFNSGKQSTFLAALPFPVEPKKKPDVSTANKLIYSPALQHKERKVPTTRGPSLSEDNSKFQQACPRTESINNAKSQNTKIAEANTIREKGNVPCHQRQQSYREVFLSRQTCTNQNNDPSNKGCAPMQENECQRTNTLRSPDLPNKKNKLQNIESAKTSLNNKTTPCIYTVTSQKLDVRNNAQTKITAPSNMTKLLDASENSSRDVNSYQKSRGQKTNAPHTVPSCATNVSRKESLFCNGAPSNHKDLSHKSPSPHQRTDLSNEIIRVMGIVEQIKSSQTAYAHSKTNILQEKNSRDDVIQVCIKEEEEFLNDPKSYKRNSSNELNAPQALLPQACTTCYDANAFSTTGKLQKAEFPAEKTKAAWEQRLMGVANLNSEAKPSKDSNLGRKAIHRPPQDAMPVVTSIDTLSSTQTEHTEKIHEFKSGNSPEEMSFPKDDDPNQIPDSFEENCPKKSRQPIDLIREMNSQEVNSSKERGLACNADRLHGEDFMSLKPETVSDEKEMIHFSKEEDLSCDKYPLTVGEPLDKMVFFQQKDFEQMPDRKPNLFQVVDSFTEDNPHLETDKSLVIDSSNGAELIGQVVMCQNEDEYRYSKSVFTNGKMRPQDKKNRESSSRSISSIGRGKAGPVKTRQAKNDTVSTTEAGGINPNISMWKTHLKPARKKAEDNPLAISDIGGIEVSIEGKEKVRSSVIRDYYKARCIQHEAITRKNRFGDDEDSSAS